ncbi:MAG: hypothetical protein WCY30_01660 [Candidatus Neomarinimicrobiota bacterium]|jgi:hypothetical protein
MPCNKRVQYADILTNPARNVDTIKKIDEQLLLINLHLLKLGVILDGSKKHYNSRKMMRYVSRSIPMKATIVQCLRNLGGEITLAEMSNISVCKKIKNNLNLSFLSVFIMLTRKRRLGPYHFIKILDYIGKYSSTKITTDHIRMMIKEIFASAQIVG